AGLGAGAVAGVGVAHFTGDVHLDAGDRQVLSSPIRVEAVPPVELDASAAATLRAGIRFDPASMDDLVKRLDAVVDRLAATRGTGDVLVSLQQLRSEFDQIHLHADLPSTMTVKLQDDDRNKLLTAINRVRDVTLAEDPVASGVPRQPAADLAGVLRELETIEGMLRSSSPPRAVHAEPGGAPGASR
ncbi:MAG TPA: hypothetical protein VF457_17860, partial [Burkholderiaceae bacterium]